MLPSQNRLKKADDFNQVKKTGKKIQSSSFTLAYLKRSQQTDPRFGIIVSNNVSPVAVIRNRIKRAIREVFRQNMVYIKPEYDIVFFAKKLATRKMTDELAGETMLALRKARLLKKND